MVDNKMKLIENISDCMKLLDKAIGMHQTHIDLPEITPTSQDEMMKLMSGAKNCINSQLRLYVK